MVRSFVHERINRTSRGGMTMPSFRVRSYPGSRSRLLGCTSPAMVCWQERRRVRPRLRVELEAGDSGLRTFVSVQGSLAMSAIHSSDLRTKTDVAARRCEGRGDIGCFGLTRPDQRAQTLRAVKTFARKEGPDWV